MINNLTTREEFLVAIVIILIGMSCLLGYSSLLNQDMVTISYKQQKLQLERLAQLVPNEWWWQSQLDYVNQYFDQMRTTK